MMQSLFAALEAARETPAPFVLEGERGTGKSLLGETLAARLGKPCTVVDCASSVAMHALFGDRGTGRSAARPESASVLILDGVDELPLRLHDSTAAELKSWARVIGTCTRSLAREHERGALSDDLWGAFGRTTLLVPPLRARREDIPPLVTYVLAPLSAKTSLSAEAMSALVEHDWPGNVRELIDVLQRMVRGEGGTGQFGLGQLFAFEPERSYRETRARYDAEFERRFVKWILARHSGNVSAAARAAKMDRKHLHDMAKKHGLRGDSST
jgi:DNA-binding NtrC family response regulator